MNKETMTAVVQDYISCYHVFTILIFHLHLNNAHTDQLDPVLPIMLPHFKSLLNPPPYTVWFPSVLDFSLVYIHAEELDDSP